MDNLLQSYKVTKTRHVTIPIEGLNCPGSDTAWLEQVLSKIEGVIYYYVNPCTEMAYLEFDPVVCNPVFLLSTIQKAGFKADEFSLR